MLDDDSSYVDVSTPSTWSVAFISELATRIQVQPDCDITTAIAALDMRVRTQRQSNL
jgi:hypothetical protein